MKKQIIITMDQLSGSIDYETDGDVPLLTAEALAMIEYAKFLIYQAMQDEYRK